LWRIDLDQETMFFKLGYHRFPDLGPQIFLRIVLAFFREDFLKPFLTVLKQISETKPEIFFIFNGYAVLLQLLFEKLEKDHKCQAIVSFGELKHRPVAGAYRPVIPFGLVDTGTFGIHQQCPAIELFEKIGKFPSMAP
jgi:hypothetical protein